MRYVFILMGLAVFIAVAISSPFGAMDKLKANVLEAISPPSEEEKLIESIQSNYSALETFFVETAPGLTGKTLTAKQREALQGATQAFTETKEMLTNLEQAEEANRPGIIQTIVKKLLTDSGSSIEPTAIPSHCRLECSAQ